MSLTPVHIVWFKRDLRVSDHAPLADAARLGAVLPLYVVEPGLWQQPDASARQYGFLTECLATLDRDLTALGQPLVVRKGDMIEVLGDLAQQVHIAGLWSHEETGNGWTYTRDKQVARWCRERAIPWTECPQNGVIRRLGSRNGWASKWDALMAQPVVDPPRALTPLGLLSDAVPTPDALGLAADPCPGRQRGGRDAAMRTLDSFLDTRGRNYRFEMSSPVTATRSCSRLSPHLAFGTLSMREVAHATRARYYDLTLAGRDPDADAWKKSLISFTGRLHWHCHFMQKLESEPELEWRNLHRAYDGLRPNTADAATLMAYTTGQTGFPFVDACLRALDSTGWINFRMRAMLVSFASYQLWLPWRDTGLHLARQFTDFEPGIHWPQVQMQSGTTGINTVRMYNPVKQGYDQDPTGAFVRRWVPELADLPDHAIHEPWRFPELASLASSRYPARIVDHVEAARQARVAVWSVRATKPYREAADAIQNQHGSRKSGLAQPFDRKRKPRAKPAKSPTTQLDFDL
jgi:deoxyribodipyrimidine photo-lyase